MKNPVMLLGSPALSTTTRPLRTATLVGITPPDGAVANELQPILTNAEGRDGIAAGIDGEDEPPVVGDYDRALRPDPRRCRGRRSETSRPLQGAVGGAAIATTALAAGELVSVKTAPQRSLFQRSSSGG